MVISRAIYRFKVADCDQLNFNFDDSTFNCDYPKLILPLHGVHTNLIEPTRVRFGMGQAKC